MFYTYEGKEMMIKLVELECPNCGGNLEKVSDEMARCPHCDTEFLIDRGEPEQVTNIYHTPQRNPLPIIICIIVAVLVSVCILIANSNSDSTSDNESTQSEYQVERFRSEFFNALVKEIYGTSGEEVTEEELLELTSLNIYWENGCEIVEYTRDNGEVKKIEFSGTLKSDWSELRNFPNLVSLKLYNSVVPQVALEQLNNLTEIWSDNSPEDLAESLPAPEKLISLGCYEASTLNGVGTFVNLQQLYVNDYHMTDIGALSALTKLKKLEIVDGDAITDFGVLHSLNQLELLVLDAENLKDISFVGDMSYLREFSMKNTIVMDISAIADKTTIKVLELEDNREISDYSALSSLTGLEDLTLELSSKASMPEVSNWTKLENLSLRGVKEIDFLSSLPGLKSLCLAGANCDSFYVFASLSNLEHLEIGSIYGDLSNLNMLTNLSKLKVLDMSGITVYGNVEAIFAIPNLEELNINDCSFGLNFDAISESSSLRKLYMNRLQLWENIYVQYDGALTYVDYDSVNLADKIDVVKKFPNLEELYLQGNKLPNVTFAESLSQLKKLDITNNYVTDLRPLEKLAQLEIVWCGQNSISQGTDLGENVTVVLDSEEEEKEWWK